MGGYNKKAQEREFSHYTSAEKNQMHKEKRTRTVLPDANPDLSVSHASFPRTEKTEKNQFYLHVSWWEE